MSMQLQVIKQEMPIIEFNFDEIKKGLSIKMKEYEGLIVTEDTIPACKSSQKELASLRVKIDTYRKEVKKEVEKPIKDFEGQCKELIAIIEATEQPIKDGLLVFEERRKQEKYQEVTELIKLKIADFELLDHFSGQLTITDKYLNKTESMDSIDSDLMSRCTFLKEQQDQYLSIKKATENQIEVMNQVFNLDSPLTSNDFNFLVTDTIDQVIKTIAETAKRRSDIETQAKQRAQAELEASKAKTEAFIAQQQAALDAALEVVPVVEPVAVVEPIILTDDPVMTYTLKLTGKKSALMNLKSWLKTNDISIEKVD